MYLGGRWANRNPAGRLSRQRILIQCETHTHLREYLPIASAHLPGKCISISHCLVSFCIECHQQTGTYLTGGLLFWLLLVLREVLLFEGSGLCAVPKLDPMARQRGLKAYPRSWERLSRLQEPEVPQEGAAHQAKRDCPRQLLYQRLREALPLNACRSSSFFCSWLSLTGIY